MGPASQTAGSANSLVTRQFSLSTAEWATTGLAAVVSTAAYLNAGYPYLARGVVGDLAGFGVLGTVGLLAGARVRHEAALCLVAIGVVLSADPQWPLQLPELAWWGLFSVGLGGYLSIRKHLCA